MDAVSDILVERSSATRGLPRMVTVSAVLHVLLAAGIVVWSAAHPPGAIEDLRPVMTISLGGSPGPRTGGTNMMERPLQASAPLPEAPRPEAVRAPAAKAPAMVLPDPKARTRATTKAAAPANDVVPKLTNPKGAGFGTPVLANRGMGFSGLSTGGGGSTSGYLDVQDFCCPDYLVTMLQVIQKNWNPRQEVGGEVLVKFRILRDGRIMDIELEKSSGYAALDLTSQRALFLTQRVPALPAAYTADDRLTIHLRFEYQR